MAERLIAAPFFCTLVAVAASPAAGAQAGLADPTRPPAGTSVDETASTAALQPKAAHRLQSVLISPKRKLAVIDGRTVPLGGRIDDAVLIAINETGVTLRRGEQTEVLPLNAGVQKKAVQP
jgi:MSHA biogenesis protein MshK